MQILISIYLNDDVVQRLKETKNRFIGVQILEEFLTQNYQILAAGCRQKLEKHLFIYLFRVTCLSENGNR